jgi:hypothetical protein
MWRLYYITSGLPFTDNFFSAESSKNFGWTDHYFRILSFHQYCHKTTTWNTSKYLDELHRLSSHWIGSWSYEQVLTEISFQLAACSIDVHGRFLKGRHLWNTGERVSHSSPSYKWRYQPTFHLRYTKLWRQQATQQSSTYRQPPCWRDWSLLARTKHYFCRV